MSYGDHEPFSNPLLPTGLEMQNDPNLPLCSLTNEDFRNLVMKPFPAPVSALLVNETKQFAEKDRLDKTEDKAEKNKKKNIYYSFKKQEDTLSTLSLKYRDRARERREGIENPDYQNVDPIAVSASYKAVAPDAKTALEVAERRREMIRESKYLGGDVEHTHLVKGLDYALLYKVRNEINSKENEKRKLEEILSSHKDREDKEKIEFKTEMGKHVYEALFKKTKYPERNELFLPGRMCCVFELNNYSTDIPKTVISSKAECPSFESRTINTNDVVINKVIQIFTNSRLKQTDKRNKAKENKKGRSKTSYDSIYEDVGEYVPSMKRSKTRREKRNSYFEKPSTEDSGSSRLGPSAESLKFGFKTDYKQLTAKLTDKRKRNMPESYAECYPGAPENEDAIFDSDDEVDYSKMDMGSRKRPVSKWDFDNEVEYNEYMSNREALPKAAFQFGLKLAGGRKTRHRVAGKKSEKQKLDQELQKINQIIANKKATEPKMDERRMVLEYKTKRC